MEKDNKELVNKYFGFIIKHFVLKNETVESLKSKLDYNFETKERISFRKNATAHSIEITNVFKRSAHRVVTDALKKYADFDAFERYMQEEGYMYEKEHYETTLENILAERFIIYPSSNNQSVHNQLKRLSNYDNWEFEDIDGETEYKIAYN